MTPKINSDSTFRDDFLRGAARAFFVSAYADAAESDDYSGLDTASNGADWMDVAPETPLNSYALAGELWALLGVMNGQRSVFSLANLAAKADGHEDLDSIDAENFGHYLAMQAMGHGVSWFDDHKAFDLKVPHMECSCYTFSPDAYIG